MKVKFEPWRSLTHPYRVQWDPAYVLVRCSTLQDSRGKIRPAGTRWVIRSVISDSIDGMTERKFLGFVIPAVKYVRTSKMTPLIIGAKSGKPTVGGNPPPLRFARKSDILMFKLTHGGRL